MGIGNVLKDFVHTIIHPPHESWRYTYPTIFILFGVLTTLFYRRIIRILQSRNLWAILAVCVCFYSASGQTWNQMKKPQNYIVGKNGENNAYFSNQYRRQFQWESYIIAATCILFIVIENPFGTSKVYKVVDRKLIGCCRVIAGGICWPARCWVLSRVRLGSSL
ncbi:OST3 / OST6 family, transporter family domain-containing protein [Phthorimaea operculella]|nr:OST3 / OST6 family, transporter family domain-containing protein [Phthorimaea operculella]